MLWLRLVALAAGVSGLVVAFFFAYDPVAQFWYAFFVLMNVVQLLLGRSVKFGRALNVEERLFREKVVPMLSPAQTRKLLTAGDWLDGQPGKKLTVQDEEVSDLMFVADGRVEILVDGAKGRVEWIRDAFGE